MRIEYLEYIQNIKMNKGNLLRRISVIHAIKCNRTLDENEVKASYDRLNELKDKVISSSDSELVRMATEIEDWAGSAPIADDREIEKLFPVINRS
jgi:hypothetical protein